MREHGGKRHRRHSKRRVSGTSARKESVNPYQITEHHKVAVCCCIGGAHQPDNTVNIERWRHEAWHTLFGEMTPFDIAVYLIEKRFQSGSVRSVQLSATWQGKSHGTYHFHYRRRKPVLPILELATEQHKAWKKLFGDRSDFSILREVLSTQWTPDGYYTHVHVVMRTPRNGIIVL